MALIGVVKGLSPKIEGFLAKGKMQSGSLSNPTQSNSSTLTEDIEELMNYAGLLHRSLDLDTIFDILMGIVGRIIPTPVYNLLKVNGMEGQVIRQHGYKSIGTNEMVESRVYDIRKMKLFGRIVENRQILFLPDTHADREWKPFPESIWVRSFLAVPIVINEKVYGVINCDGKTNNQFSEQHAWALRLIADQAAIAIENSINYSETNHHLKQISLINQITFSLMAGNTITQMLNSVSTEIIRSFEADSIIIVQWNRDEKTTTLLGAFGENLGPCIGRNPITKESVLMSRVFSEKRAVTLSAQTDPVFWKENIAPWISDPFAVAYPIFANDIPLGLILAGYHSSRQIVPTVISIGEYAAQQFSAIMHQVIVLQETNKQSLLLKHANDLITSLSSVATSILSAKDFNTIMQKMGKGLEKMQIHSALLINDSEQHLLRMDYCSLKARLNKLLTSLSDDRNKRIVLRIPDFYELYAALNLQKNTFVQDSTQLVRMLIPSKYGPFANKILDALDVTPDTKALILPLIVEKRTIALLYLYGENLQEIDLRAGEIFTSQISIAMDNARLLNEVQQLAITDDLTGINNRRGLFSVGERELVVASRLGSPISCLMIDLDNFKVINDQFGHSIGDRTLQEVVRRITRNIRKIDIIGRYGGEEFVVILIANDLTAALEVAERIRSSIEYSPIETEAGPVHVTVSIGVDEKDSSVTCLGALIKRADRAMYKAKENGRNQVATLSITENSIYS
jgi:diguanylate cyclase (GGDEF)-like protein